MSCRQLWRFVKCGILKKAVERLTEVFKAEIISPPPPAFS
jgi:hypothetical protein